MFLFMVQIRVEEDAGGLMLNAYVNPSFVRAGGIGGYALSGCWWCEETQRKSALCFALVD